MRFSCLTTLLLSLFVVSAAADKNDECSIYLAESSKSEPGEFKWGLYAGQDIQPDSIVTTPDVAIHIINMAGNAKTTSKEEKDNWLESVIDFFEQFIWVPDASGGKFEVDSKTKPERIVAAIPGVGALGGYNPEMTNAHWRHDYAYFRHAVGEARGVAHAGRGAYSVFYNATMTAKHVIPKGMEVFVDYGANYETESDEDELERSDYDKIDHVVNRVLEFYDEFESEMTDEGKKDIYEFLISDVMAAVAGPRKGPLIKQLLPDNVKGLRDVKAKGGSYFFNKPGTLRDAAWLAENGLCMDNLEMGPSTIPHAGRGAFARRDIKKGGLVVPVPLIHLPSKEIMDLHKLEGDDEETLHRADDTVIGQQLMLNYCYGHPQSSMLFFPSSPGVSFINHSSKKPNAKIVWSSSKHHNPDWYKLSLEELLEDENQYMGLMFDVVATRTIKQGDEVFIDYGKDWEKAWKDHTKSWKHDKDWPLSAMDVNQDYKTKPFKTPQELETEPYPENVQIMGFLVVEVDETEQEEQQQGSQTKRKWTTPKQGSVFDTEYLQKCRVTGRKEVEDESSLVPFKYTVVWNEGEEDETTVTDVPHSALVFVDKPGTSDHFVKDAFRHFIGIPDEIFPKGPWRDLA